VCNVSFIICVVLCCVLFERGVLVCVMCYYVLCLNVVSLPPGKPHLQLKYIIHIITNISRISICVHLFGLRREGGDQSLEKPC
jgi:hypothetical protein